MKEKIDKIMQLIVDNSSQTTIYGKRAFIIRRDKMKLILEQVLEKE